MQSKTLKIIVSFVLLLMVASSFHSTSTKAANDLVVGVDTVNLRSGPGLSYSLIGSLSRGDQLTSLDRHGDWIQVSDGHKKGWVASWLVVSNSTNNSAKSSDKVVISQVNNLNIRSDASISASVLGQLASGNQATVIEEKSNWVQINYNGLTGWVAKEYVTIKQAGSKTPSTSAKGLTFTVQVDTLNIRAKASLDSKKLASVERGQTFNVLKQEDSWIQIEYKEGKKGWLYSFYGTLSNSGKVTNSANTANSGKKIQTIYNGTNLRTGPSTDHNVLARVDAGQMFSVVSEQEGWYKVAYKGQTAYIATTVVTSATSGDPGSKKSREAGTLKGLTIVVDAGHGGHDGGTQGVRGTLEKKVNLQVATSLAAKLRSAGAQVIMTRESDRYISLPTRVSISHQYAADAFVSVHHDAHEKASVRGFTTYYTNDYQRALAEAINSGLNSQVSIRNRGTQHGNYYITRENRQKAVLIELGYLSNSSEEQTLRTSQFQEQAAYGIYRGLLNFFN